jgi:hypothetical protein
VDLQRPLRPVAGFQVRSGSALPANSNGTCRMARLAAHNSSSSRQ